jgi:hypothetical protein
MILAWVLAEMELVTLFKNVTAEVSKNYISFHFIK